MTVHLEGEVVASRFDPITRTCSYTITRDGKRWTVSVPLEHLDNAAKPHAHAPMAKQARRDHLANVLKNAMNGAPDAPAGTPDDPHQPATWQDFEKVPDGASFINPADGKILTKKTEKRAD